MRFNIFKLGIFLLVVTTLLSSSSGCDEVSATQPVASSGVAKATAKVATDLSGHTTEQNNVLERYKRDNLPGSIKHLYIISAYSGQVILYSTVKGKVTSSGKRLTPTTVAVNSGEYHAHDGIDINIDGKNYETGEVLQDDGTYGSSVEYLYWFDSKGVYHQQYITGGMILHISDQPISVKNVIINLEQTNN